MNIYFDYVYYSLTRFYFKWDGKTGINGILAISLIQALLLFDIVLPIIRTFYSIHEINPYSKSIGIFGVVVLFAFVILNYRKYRNKYDQLRALWENETHSEKITRGLLMILSFVLPWIPLIIIGSRT